MIAIRAGELYRFGPSCPARSSKVFWTAPAIPSAHHRRYRVQRGTRTALTSLAAAVDDETPGLGAGCVHGRNIVSVEKQSCRVSGESLFRPRCGDFQLAGKFRSAALSDRTVEGATRRELSELPQYPAVAPGARIPLRDRFTTSRQLLCRNIGDSGPAARQTVQAPSLHSTPLLTLSPAMVSSLTRALTLLRRAQRDSFERSPK